jgi:hypothetical protein
MPVKLSEREKNARGTAQKCRTLQARPLKVVRTDIRDLRQIISDVGFNLQLARQSVHDDGLFLEVVVADSNGKLNRTKKITPALKIQREALTSLKSLNRQLVLLHEEEAQGVAKQHTERLSSEFAI